jgi:hypothetical protein
MSALKFRLCLVFILLRSEAAILHLMHWSEFWGAAHLLPRPFSSHRHGWFPHENLANSVGQHWSGAQTKRADFCHGLLGVRNRAEE